MISKGTLKADMVMEFVFLKIKNKIRFKKLQEFERILQMEVKILVKRVIEESQHMILKNQCTETERVMR